MTISSIDELFSLAVARELEANAFYSAVAKKSNDKAVRKIFEGLANEEMGHMELLERFRADPTLPMKIKAPSADFKIAESTPLPELTINAKPADAIALAMKKEQQAVEFYRTMAASASNSELKEIFENLANMELGHKHKLENLFVDIGYPEAF